jgi:DNA modification methylase
MQVVAISTIKPNPSNPRLIKDDKFHKLVQSLKDFPEMANVRPIVVNQDMVILGGNMRFKAMKEAKWKEIPVEVVNWDEAKQREFIIKDNVGFGEWDWDDLANNWNAEELEAWGLDVPAGFTEEPEAEEDDYEIPDEIQTDIVLGDLFEIGEHRLLCGDSTDSDAVAKLMDGQKADMVLTDPPYNVNYGGNNNPSWKQGDRSIKNDHMDGDSFKDFIQGVVSNMKLFCDGVVYCFGAQGADGRIMFSVLDENLHNSGTIIWLKDRLVLGRSKYHNKYEPCWFGWNKSGDTFTDDRSLTNVFECKRPSKSDLHPTMKPIELLEMPLNHNPKANSVLDLFLGSGSTMVAAHQLKRKCYGMELDPKYCQVIVDRMLKLDPTLQIKRNGQPYLTEGTLQGQNKDAKPGES